MATISLPARTPDTHRKTTTRLILLDDTVVPRPQRHPKRRRARHSDWGENMLFLAAVVAIALFCVIGVVRSVSRSWVISPVSVPAMTLPVTVRSGDTLWTYAQRYGAPDAYILDRVESIARANGLAADAALVPGEHLRIPVTNPVIIAQLQSRHRIAERDR